LDFAFKGQITRFDVPFHEQGKWRNKLHQPLTEMLSTLRNLLHTLDLTTLVFEEGCVNLSFLAHARLRSLDRYFSTHAGQRIEHIDAHSSMHIRHCASYD
jgi:hypothetical protein